MNDSRFTVENRPEESRYVLRDSEGNAEIGQIRYVDVTSTPNQGESDRVMFLTEVSQEYAGQGLASVLVRAAFDDVKEHSLSAVAVCPYIKSRIPKHPEYESLVKSVRPEHLQAIP